MSMILDANGEPWRGSGQTAQQPVNQPVNHPVHQSVQRTALHNSFSNSTRDRLRGGTRGPTGSANAHRDSRTLERLIQDCQQVARNDLIAASIISARADSIVGDDPIFEALSEDEAWNTEVEMRFAEWCESQCDLSGTLSFAQICSSIVNRWDDSGGALVNKVIRGTGKSARCRLETIEILRLVNPGRKQDSKTMHGGVEISEETGAAVAYHIGDWNEQGTMVGSNPTRWDASNIWLLNNPRGLAPGQHRAEPLLSRVIDRLETIDQSTEASWTSYQLAANISLFITRQTMEGARTEDQMAAAMVTAGLARTVAEAKERGVWNPGSVMEGMPGEGVQTIDPAHPVTGFDAMLWTELQNIFAAMDTAPELVALRFIKNFAASRAALSVIWRRVQFYQQALRSRFMLPVYRWWVCNEIQTQRLKEVKGWRNGAWHLPLIPVLDRKTEVEGILLELSGGLMNHDKSLRILGSGSRESFMKKWKTQTAENLKAGLVYSQPVQVTRSEQTEPYAVQDESGANADA